MSLVHRPTLNHLLAALPPVDLARLAPHLELVPMMLGEMLYEPGQQLRHAFFPTTAILSMHYVMESGATAESAGVGNEGVLGISLFMGGDTTPSSAVVQTKGHAYRLEGRLLKQEFARDGILKHLLLGYTHSLITQIGQIAACNRHHSLEQQLCRFLLLTLDRVSSNELVMTQDLVAGMLGVRREGVTEAAGNLQRAGFIRYRRGHIAVVDRVGLEARACECYAVLAKELNRHHLEGGAAPAAASRMRA
jgi:CRP-like cAMP-binding protein